MLRVFFLVDVQGVLKKNVGTQLNNFLIFAKGILIEDFFLN